MNLYTVHTDEDYWKDPHHFRPERHLSPDGKKLIKTDHLIPFSAGKYISETQLRESHHDDVLILIIWPTPLNYIYRQTSLFGRAAGPQYLLPLHDGSAEGVPIPANPESVAANTGTKERPCTRLRRFRRARSTTKPQECIILNTALLSTLSLSRFLSRNYDF